MNKFFSAFTLAAALLVGAHAEPAKPSPSPAPRPPSGPPTYDSFRLVRTRNVFDPDRRPVRPVTNAPAPVAGRADYVTLTGTLLTPDKTYAFFSGSRSEFNRVLTVKERIASATIAGITVQHIEIERDGKRTVVAVGQTVPFDNQTAPGVPPVAEPPAPVAASVDGAASGSAAAATPPPSYAPRPAVTAGTTSAPPKGPSANVDEIRRRMMEKRQQELK